MQIFKIANLVKHFLTFELYKLFNFQLNKSLLTGERNFCFQKPSFSGYGLDIFHFGLLKAYSERNGVWGYLAHSRLP
ncbi:hypothetical protein C4572_03400 [Candidatus Parcubacteria bacterium]|nr:MAG: hypothetical protein C4572_03400 [Candidatus Parcubacteria bacterium]